MSKQKSREVGSLVELYKLEKWEFQLLIETAYLGAALHLKTKTPVEKYESVLDWLLWVGVEEELLDPKDYCRKEDGIVSLSPEFEERMEKLLTQEE